MRTRDNNWLNMNTHEVKLGIDVSKDGKRWKHLAVDGEPYFAKTENERQDKRKELRKLKML